jgi:hypothetical protein
MKKRHLSVIANETCFSAYEKSSFSCTRKTCQNWINYDEGKNCVIITSKSGPKTLQEVGKIYGLTRMRICQIEKNIYEKIKSVIENY